MNHYNIVIGGFPADMTAVAHLQILLSVVQNFSPVLGWMFSKVIVVVVAVGGKPVGVTELAQLQLLLSMFQNLTMLR